ncbi:outer membrane protein assembly factor BamA, partial [Parvularcula dongshanensis]|uniref:outer membrane protein assembly factor BamA n=1 Tax=Parvularcula dongshanensis TaxID=1173995 RepID=UPI001FE44D51
AALLLGASALGLISPAAAQQASVPAPPQQAQAPIVQRIIVTGNQRIEGETVRSYLPVAPGSPIDQLTIDTALKTLFGTGLFADAQIVYDQPSGTLQVAVVENPIVNRILYEGNRRTKEDKFAEEVQLEPRAVYTQAKVQADVQRILQIYRQSGRFGATVTPKIVELPQNRVDVIFEIEEGPKTGVAKINFIGNEAFTDSQLRGAVLTAESHWWDILESNDNYDPDRLDYDRQLLREFYTQQGYADFSVTSAVAELTPDRKDFFITFTVDEGPQYEFGRVDVRTTLSRVPNSVLERSIPVRTGQQFNSELMEQAEEAITFATGVAGYAFVEVNPRLNRNEETRTIDVTFEVNEGPRVYVERIDIGGNISTLDRVIRREMRLAEGDAFNRVLLDRSERAVRSLGYFSDVSIQELPGSAPDRTILDVDVTEQSTGSFQIGGG